MKNVKNLLILIAVAFTFAACTNLEKILIFQDGIWNVDQRTNEVYVSGILNVSQTDTLKDDGTIIFNKNLTGSYTEGDGDTGTFTWAYDKEAEVLTVVEDGDSLFYDVIDTEFKAQKLRSETVTKVLGIEYRDVRTLEITR